MKNIFILLLCLSSSLFAQNKYTVSGFVKELSSSEELIGANIVCEQLRIGATTNSYGFYSITLPEGTYSFRYSFIQLHIFNGISIKHREKTKKVR